MEGQAFRQFTDKVFSHLSLPRLLIFSFPWKNSEHNKPNFYKPYYSCTADSRHCQSTRMIAYPVWWNPNAGENRGIQANKGRQSTSSLFLISRMGLPSEWNLWLLQENSVTKEIS
jgi:hypothetical protein